MNLRDTIIACSTGSTNAPRALVRLSGPEVPRLARAIAGEISPRLARAGVLRTKGSDRGRHGAFELPVLCVRFVAPASYTGQDMLELLLPGNPALVDRVVEAIIAEKIGGAEKEPEVAAIGGVRRAEPGEFSARAFLHGKLSLEQAEGVAGVIGARNAAQLSAAQRLMRGATGERYRAWTDELAGLLALVEAGIDFTDQEDVVAMAPSALLRRVRAVDDAIAHELGPMRSRAATGSLPVVLIVGEPSAGKSTLFNALLGARRAVESPERGTTRDVLCEELDLGARIPGAGRIVLCDSAGLDESGSLGPSDSAAQSATRAAIDDADVIVYCDPAGAFPKRFRGAPVRVRTKGDRAMGTSTPADAPPAAGAYQPCDAPPPIPVCALDGWNLSVLCHAIADAAGVGGSEGLAVARHASAMRSARVALARVVAGVSADVDPRAAPCVTPHSLAHPETIAESLREALDHLGSISGRITSDDILGKVFSSFCVGK
jgi:tRNA modification GTPase